MPTVAEQIFEIIVGDILSGRIRPKDVLSERALVNRLGASRTPIREALKRLKERGYLASGSKGVAVVRDMSLDEIEKLYALRLRIERTAALLTAKLITGAEVMRLLEINGRFADAVERRDLVEMLEVRSEFHSAIAAATRNSWLAEIMIDLRDKAYPVRHWHWQDLSRARETVRLHRTMIGALRRRDARRYSRLVEEQIRGALEAYRNRLVAVPAERTLARRAVVAPVRKRALSGKMEARS